MLEHRSPMVCSAIEFVPQLFFDQVTRPMVSSSVKHV